MTPPPELVEQWINEYLNEHPEGLNVEVLVVSAAQWGADQELEACLRLVEIDGGEDAYDFARYIRVARRPKPPSLKQQALDRCNDYIDPDGIIRRALEALDD
jgi:hypothetical protein